MKKLLIYRDNSRIKDNENKLKYVQGYLNEFYQDLIKWDVLKWSFDDLVAIVSEAIPIQRINPTYIESIKGGVPVKIDHIALAEVITEYLKTRAVNETEQPKVFGFKLSKAKLIEMIEVPEPPIELLEALNLTSGAIRQKFEGSLDMSFFGVSGTTIILKRDALLEFEEKCNHYATTKGQIEMAKETFKFCDALNEFGEYGKGKSQFSLKVEAVNGSYNAILEKNGKFYPDYSFINRLG